MRNTYPIVLIPEETGFTVFIPDFDINTEGGNLTEAIEMARDAIGLVGIDMEDDGKTLPSPSPTQSVRVRDGETVAFVNIDFTEYRRKKSDA